MKVCLQELEASESAGFAKTMKSVVVLDLASAHVNHWALRTC